MVKKKTTAKRKRPPKTKRKENDAKRLKQVKAICKSIAGGVLIVADACALEGVKLDTFNKWRQQRPEVSTLYAKAKAKRNIKTQQQIFKRVADVANGTNSTQLSNGDLWLMRRALHKSGLKDLEWENEKQKRQNEKDGAGADGFNINFVGGVFEGEEETNTEENGEPKK